MKEATRSLTHGIIEDLVAAHKVIGNLSMSDHRGHVSARLGNGSQIFIKARLSKEIPNHKAVTNKHIARMNLKGDILDLDPTLELPREYYIHTWIYKNRPDVNSVVHIHPMYTILMGIVGKKIKPLYHVRDAKIVSKELPVFNDPRLITNDSLGASLAKTLGPADACLMRWHGIVTVGKNIHEAVLNAIKIEKQAEYNFRALQIGEPEEIPRKYLKNVEETQRLLDADWAYFAAAEA